MIVQNNIFFPEIKIITPKIYEDNRGHFFEAFNKKLFDKMIIKTQFTQDNESHSKKGVLRGLHYQKKPHQQAKLVRVLNGEILDVVVDIRPKSKKFGKWISVKLNSKNKKQLWIPEGFAHGFVVTSQKADILYKTSDFYSKQCDVSINPFDPDINIKWPKNLKFSLSKKDETAKYLRDLAKNL